jgi:hypothetical protein
MSMVHVINDDNIIVTQNLFLRKGKPGPLNPHDAYIHIHCLILVQIIVSTAQGLHRIDT